MKLTWKNQNKKKRSLLAPFSLSPNLPFDQNDDDSNTSGDPPNRDHRQNDAAARETLTSDTATELADSFQSQGDQFAQDGKYPEALGKWEAALNLKPEKAVLHEQKAQVLLEIGEAWKALKAATNILFMSCNYLTGATELEPQWAEAWITLGRAQLNFGEPDSAAESFDRALAIKPDLVEARDDRQMALNLTKKRKLLHSSGLSSVENRYVVGEKSGSS